jgi:hypothetical protein
MHLTADSDSCSCSNAFGYSLLIADNNYKGIPPVQRIRLQIRLGNWMDIPGIATDSNPVSESGLLSGCGSIDPKRTFIFKPFCWIFHQNFKIITTSRIIPHKASVRIADSHQIQTMKPFAE